MSENDIQKILLLLGAIEERTRTTNEQLKLLTGTVEQLKERGCTIGKENKEAITELQVTVKDFKNIWRKAVLIMAGVGVGSVGLKEMLQKILTILAQ